MNTMLNVLLVGVGGFLGSVFRYLLNNFIYSLLSFPLFPYGTMVVNLIGCLIIGFLAGFSEYREAFTPELRLFLFIGVLGGFTTFSSFGYDTFGLLRGGQWFLAFMNVFIQVVVGLVAVWFGFLISKYI